MEETKKREEVSTNEKAKAKMNELAGSFLKLALTRFSHMKMTEPFCLGHKSGLTTRSAYILSTYCNQRLSVVINGV